jgi:allantoin racemase
MKESGVKLLLVNGNRTQAVTDTVLAEARLVASQGTVCEAVTAKFGMDIVFSHAGDAIAAHAVLDSLARHHAGFDAAILAISFDSGLAAARELLPIPVLGITESSLRAAAALGERIGVITFGTLSRKLYDDVFARSGVLPSIAAIRTIDIASASEYLAPAQLDARIAATANALADEEGVDAVVICGAAMSGVARRLKNAVRVPVIDGVAAAVIEAEALVGAGFRNPARTPGPVSRAAGVSPELAALFERM